MEKHPIALENQSFFVPDNAVSGDVIGNVNYLWTFCKFWNDRNGTDYEDSDFSFSLISGSGFEVNASNGSITVDSLSGLPTDTSIVVRVSIDSMYIDVTCSIQIVDSNDCYFFDYNYVGTSTGTRAQPYTTIRESGLTPTAGKYYFWKRGTTFLNEWSIIINPVVGGNYPDWITYDSYGQGERPIIDGSINDSSGTNRRFVDIGGAGLSNSNLDPSLVGNKFRIANIDTTHDKSNDWYPFQIRGLGNFLEFRNIYMENTIFSDGFMYFAVYTSVEYEDREIYLENIRTKNSEERSIKIEAGGVSGNNFYCINTGATLTEHPAPSIANWPNVNLKYIYAEGENISSSDLGLQLRASLHTYEWFYIKGFGNALTAYIHSALDGRGGLYDVTNSGYKNGIIEDAQSTSSYFGRQGGTTGVVDDIWFTNIKLINCNTGFQVAEGAKNVLINYCDLSGTDTDGLRVFSGAGTGVKVHNITAFGNGSNDIELSRSGIEVTNCNYGTISGTATGSNNSTSTDENDLINAGTWLGYTHDSQGNPVPPVNPSIGAYEFETEQTLTILVAPVSGGTTNLSSVAHGEDEIINLIATPASGYVFVNWTKDSSEISTDADFNYTAPFENETITANFSNVDVYSLDVVSTGNGTVTGSGSYEEGEQVEITATANSLYEFDGWYINDVLLSSLSLYIYTMPAEAVEIEGRFSLIPTPDPENPNWKRCETWLNGFFFEYNCGSNQNSNDMSNIQGLQYRVVEDLAEEPVTLEFFKQHVRVDFDTDANLLSSYLKSARQYLEEYSQLSFGEKKIKLMALKLPNNYRLQHGPVQSIVDDTYTLFGDIVKDAGGTDVEFEFITGWTPELPESIKIAICQYGCGNYINRENIVTSTSGSALIDQALKVMNQYRGWFVV